jgi:hypothetical protein
VSLCWVSMPRTRMRKWRNSSTLSWSRYWMELGAQFHYPVCCRGFLGLVRATKITSNYRKSKPDSWVFQYVVPKMTELKNWIYKTRNVGLRLSDDSQPPLLHCRRWTARRQAVWRQVTPRGRSDAVPRGNRRSHLFKSDFAFAFKAFSLLLWHLHLQLRKLNCNLASKLTISAAKSVCCYFASIL